MFRKDAGLIQRLYDRAVSLMKSLQKNPDEDNLEWLRIIHALDFLGRYDILRRIHDLQEVPDVPFADKIIQKAILVILDEGKHGQDVRDVALSVVGDQSKIEVQLFDQPDSHLLHLKTLVDSQPDAFIIVNISSGGALVESRLC